MRGQRILGQLVLVVCLTLWTGTEAQMLEPPYALNQSMIYFSSVNFTIKDADTKLKKTVAFTTATVDPSSFDNTTYASLKLNFDGEGKGDGISVTGFELTLIVQKIAGWWIATNYTITAATAQMDGKTLMPITNLELVSYDGMSAPLQMSFHCGRFGPLFPKVDPANPNARNFTPSIELIDFQYQAFNFKHNTTYFDRPYDCVGFFSIGILSGIFVTILLMGVLTWGIVMIMNLNTMDRFDDPKGKQITVTATD